ncbi:N-acetyltransferase [Jeotgalibacillus sp. S-D1]|uniref:GNAT family N-acetyltransferase n=1 Tax=Jeotgalibacillus sp. S-D1 TaxID=2552189 RepID=UPI00105A4844|nr:GNAT family N-acetyltransferase [Jeotgalibacillus sp. S-D1]TDL31291.1 N-acetyltransferase [Jeotgalibacillus sp. S-D1]
MYFSTSRLRVRKAEWSDYPAFHEMQSSERVMGFIIGRAKTESENRNEMEKILASYNHQKQDFLVMVISRKDDKQDLLIGTCAIIKNEEGEYEIGYRLSEAFWGKGFGSEVLEGLIDYCFQRTDISSVVATVHKDNLVSCKILDRSPMELIKETIDKETKEKVRIYKLEKM